jgi:ATP-dependent Clp protease ATP-binding subunit ClpC
LEEIRELKNVVVKKQKIREAAKLRDDEKRIEKKLLPKNNGKMRKTIELKLQRTTLLM